MGLSSPTVLQILNGEMKHYLVLRLWVHHAEPPLGKQCVPSNHEKSWVTGNPVTHCLQSATYL